MSEAWKIRDQEALYFLTMRVVFWLDVFTRKECRDTIIDSFIYCREKKNLEVYAYVIMSNHIHLIVRSKNGSLSDTIRDFKKYTASEIIDYIENGNESRKNWLLNEMAFAAENTKETRNTSFGHTTTMLLS